MTSVAPGKVVVLVGPKGAGKSTIGAFLAAELGIRFLRVEPLFLEVRGRLGPSHPEFERRGFEAVLAALRDALAAGGTVCFESTGASEHFGWLLSELRNDAHVLLVRVVAKPEQCVERIRGRDASIHIPVSDDDVERVNALAERVVLPWAAEIDNRGAFDGRHVAETVRRLLGAPEVRATVFVGVSVDGFLARPNHDLDFLPPGGGEDHGYAELFASVDALVIGRNTWDKIVTFPEWPYGEKPVFVLSSRPLGPLPPAAKAVERMEGAPAEVVRRLAARGARHLYVDGGLVIQQFLRAGLIQRLVVTRVPVLIGSGIPLFGPLPADVPLRHVATRHFPSGLVQSEYLVGTAAPEPAAG